MHIAARRQSEERGKAKGQREKKSAQTDKQWREKGKKDESVCLWKDRQTEGRDRRGRERLQSCSSVNKMRKPNSPQTPNLYR